MDRRSFFRSALGGLVGGVAGAVLPAHAPVPTPAIDPVDALTFLTGPDVKMRVSCDWARAGLGIPEIASTGVANDATTSDDEPTPRSQGGDQCVP